jgi:putative ABC transport system permease protein
MLKNYLKVAFRNLWKNKKFSFINIFGLAIGMACSLLIFLFVQDEKSYDGFHKDAGLIHRVVKDFINDDGSLIPDATTPAALAPAMQREIPEVVKITRVFPTWSSRWMMTYGNKKITEDKFFRVDSSFFDVFTFPFVKGSASTALKDVNSIVVTESAAKRYFGSEDPIGKVIKLDPGGDMMVSAVIKDVPPNAHFHFDFLGSFRQLPANLDQDWLRYNYYTYVKVKPGTVSSQFRKKIQAVYERNQEERYSIFHTQALRDIHLTSNLKWELEPNSDKLYVYVFTIVGLFILLIAGINYVNLSTAKASVRAREIGVRKVAGALRASLVHQFLLESVISSLIASSLAIVIAQLLLPIANDLTQKQLTIFGNPYVLGYMAAAALFIGMIAGLFPALYLSSFKPINVLKGLKLNERRTFSLRRALVVVQFTISSVLIIAVLIINQQMKYIQSANLGLNKDQVLIVRNAGALSASDRNAYLNTIRQFPGIKKAALSSLVIGRAFATTRIRVKGSDKEQQINFSNIGFDYLDVMGIEMKEGRGFSQAYAATDTMRDGMPGGPLEQTIGSIVINERAVKELGLGTPAIGKQILWNNDGDTSYYMNVIGVTKDFHFTSLRNEIMPFGFTCRNRFQGNFTVKLAADNIQGTIAQLEREWKKVPTERPFEYLFADEVFAKLYVSEARFEKVFISLVVLGIVIACLGLLGLATFAAQQRVKEIGIRKTLGASVQSIVLLLSKDFIKLVFIALIIASPVAWFVMSGWLNDFAYRIHISWWIFLIAGIIAVLIAVVTISSQAIKAAIANPVKSLKTE